MLLPGIFILTAIAFATAEVGPSDEYILPQIAEPLEYTLFIDPRPDPQDNFTFTGFALIEVLGLQPVSFIELHAAEELEVSRVSVVDIIGVKTVPVLRVVRDNVLETLRVVLGQRLVPGDRYFLQMSFGGQLRDDMLGLYRSSYQTAEGETRWLAATQFEATFARSSFPCWDEPRYKAKFSINIQRQPNYTVTANMPLKRSTPALNGRYWDTFQTTEPMSSYLVAFIVSDFGHLSNPTGNYSVWVQKEDLNQMEYAVDLGPRSLAAIESLTKIPYMLPKMDLAAIPDFDAGAMENWGMITFRAADVMYLEGESPESAKRTVATVITHEQGHQWFGDWVSPAWWRYIWLNEAFANYLEILGTAVAEPKWRLDELFPSMCNQYAMPYEALPTTHPLSNNAYSPDEIAAVFDTTTYQAGASKLRMIDWYMGDDNFWKGLNLYLNTMSLSVGTQEELFKALAAYAPSEPPLPDIFRTWTEQPGYPLVTVQRLLNGSAVLTQQRHFYLRPNSTNGNCDCDDQNDEKWWIPLTWTSQSEADFNATGADGWLSPDEKQLTVQNLKSGEWVIFNLQSAGYYRVQYDDIEWARLAEALSGPDRDLIHPINRGSLVDDAMSLAQSNYLDYTVALPMTKYLENEVDPVPWNSAYLHFEFLNKQLLDSDALPSLYAYLRTLIGKVYDNIGYKAKPGEDSLTKITREDMTFWACRINIEDCLQNARSNFNALQTSNTEVSPDVRSAVYCTAVQTDSPNYSQSWDFLWQRYQDTRIATEKELLMSALACTNDTGILKRYISETISASTKGSSASIRPQDASLVFDAIADSGPVGAQVALAFLRENMTIAADVYGNTGLGRVIDVMGDVLNTQDDVDQFKQVLSLNAKVITATGQQSVAESAVKVAEGNVQWRQQNLQTVKKWLQSNSQ